MLVRTWSCGLFFALREQPVELAGILERIELVAAADVSGADENLRHRASPVRPRAHRLARWRVPGDVDFMELHTFARKQFPRPVTIGTKLLRVDFYGSHNSALSLSPRPLYGRLHRIGNPRKNQHVDIRRAGPKQRPGTALNRRTRGQDVIDKHEPLPGDRGFALGRHAKCAL